MVLPIIAGQAIIHGLRIAGLRILPYIVREATKKSATYAAKKVGQKSITETGYVIVTKDPTKFRLAQQIFGKNKFLEMKVFYKPNQQLVKKLYH